MKKQYLKTMVSITTTPLWKLIVSFSVNQFGPNSKLWGKTADSGEIDQISTEFEKFYNEHRNEFPDSPEYRQLFREDLEDTKIYVELLNKKKESEEENIKTYFENLNLLMQKQTFHGPQRLVSPPPEAYRWVGHNELNIGEGWENREKDYHSHGVI